MTPLAPTNGTFSNPQISTAAQQQQGGYNSILTGRLGSGLGSMGSMGGYGGGYGTPFNVGGMGGMNAGLGSLFGGFNPMMGMMGGYGQFGGFNPMMGMMGGYGQFGGFNPMMGMMGGYGQFGGFNPMGFNPMMDGYQQPRMMADISKVRQPTVSPDIAPYKDPTRNVSPEAPPEAPPRINEELQPIGMGDRYMSLNPRNFQPRGSDYAASYGQLPVWMRG
jgi:hypothetical protein